MECKSPYGNKQAGKMYVGGAGECTNFFNFIE